jgi:hypothetical protein
MKYLESSLIALRPLAVLVAILMFPGSALAAGPKGGVIHRFQGGTADGDRPFAGLIADAAGNLYGTTLNGGNGPADCYGLGNTGCGTVFELIRPTTLDGIWTETVLYSFQAGTDGYGPLGGVIFDQAGNLYGTTTSGGENPGCLNCGTVFELTPPASAGGVWTETVLYRFGSNSNDGADPMGSLVFDKAGNLYGTTFIDGSGTSGTGFQLSPPSSPGSAWTETVIYNFTGGKDGALPEIGLIIDNAGVLYGTTSSGGRYLSCNALGGGCGTVFKLVPPAMPGGAWSEHVLYAFGGQADDGRSPAGSLVFDVAGNLYSTTSDGGIYDCGHQSHCGTVFELTPPASGKGAWTETIIYNFKGGNDGSYPQNNVTFDSQGALYGTTGSGGGGDGGGACPGYCGTVFKLVPPAISGGTWTEQLLHRFGIQPGDGIAPSFAGLLRVGDTFYGTTGYGGGVTSTCSIGCGTVFKLVP